MKTKRLLLLLATAFFIWRVVLQLIAHNAYLFLPYKPSFAGPDSLLVLSKYSDLYSWANFDGVHYLTIAGKGYVGTALIQAFFPLYPLTITFFNTILHNPLISAMLVSNLAFFLLLYVWYAFFSEIYSQKVTLLSLLLLLIFPTSFFFTSVYSESLFLCLIIGAFFCAHKSKWHVATLLAFFATMTRIVGVFLVIALLVEYYNQHSNEIKKLNAKNLILFLDNHKRNILLICSGALGIICYSIYLKITFGDPFYFYTVQSQFGAGRQSGIVLLPQVIWRYLKILLTANPYTWSYYAAVQEIFLSGITILTLYFASIKKYNIRFSWLVFGIGCFLLPTLTGTFLSIPRHILVVFPLFLIAAQLLENRKLLLYITITISTILLIINTILFIQGYWVA